MEPVEQARQSYAKELRFTARVRSSAVVNAFATVPREQFVGPGPWRIKSPMDLAEYWTTDDDDPSHVYHDVLIALDEPRGINNGQPSLWACLFDHLNLVPREQVLHLGSGTGYYTAILAKLTGPAGSVIAYEIEPDLAQSAIRNLKSQPNVTIRPVSATVGILPECDAIYVNAGATDPLDLWLNALRPSGRLLFPLTPSEGPDGMPGVGGMLLLTRVTADSFHARFLSSAIFIPCVGARDETSSAKLTECFRRGDMRSVHSFHRNRPSDQTCWCSGKHWWLSTSALPCPDQKQAKIL